MIIDYSESGVLNLHNKHNWFTTDQLCLLEKQKSSIIDRTSTLDTGLNLTVIDKIPTGNTIKTFEEICEQEAERIVKLNRPIAVYWSGGIDSTLALISLIKAGAVDITVVMTSASILEYPLFYNIYIKNKLKVRRVRPSIIPDVDPNELIVTGEFGDQAMGSVVILDYPDFHNIQNDAWEPYVRAKYGDRYIELIGEQLKHAPFPIITVFDYLWWMNYSCKWQHVLVRMSGINTEHTKLFMNNVEHFYRADDFQRWSMNEDNHRSLKLKDTPSSYKFVMKTLIADFTKDTTYERDKLKLGSLRDSTANEFLFKLNTGVSIKAEDYNESFEYLIRK